MKNLIILILCLISNTTVESQFKRIDHQRPKILAN
jgi:hypothetical protein